MVRGIAIMSALVLIALASAADAAERTVVLEYFTSTT